MFSSKLGCIDGSSSCAPSNKKFRKSCWADLKDDEEPEAPKDLDLLVEPSTTNSTAAVSSAGVPVRQSPMKPDATVFVPIDASNDLCSEVSWLREIVEAL